MTETGHTPGTLGRARPTRRSLLAALAAAGAGTAVTGCADAVGTAAGSTPLRYWNLFAGGDGVRMVELGERFAAAHPAISLEPTTLAWGQPYYTKLAMACAGGRAPDVSILHLARLPGYAPGRLLDPFPPDLLEEAGITRDKFLPALWEAGTVDGQVYAIPFDTHPFVMYYNTDICGAAGLLDADGRLKPMQGPEELLAAFAAAREVTGDLGLSIGTLTVNPWRLFWTLYRQLDGQVLDAGGTEMAIDDDKALEALRFMQRLSQEGLAPRTADREAVIASFGSGRAGFLFYGEWEVTTFEENGLPFGMAPFPNVFGNDRTQGDSHSFVLPHQIERDPEVTRAAVTYIAWMLENSLYWAGGGHIPAFQPVVRNPEYENLQPQAQYREVAEDVQLDPPAWFSGSASELQNQAGAAFGAVHAGTLTPEQALEQFKAALQTLLDTPAPV
ncbi:extracellular solute-binding protein [Kineococcus sp. SYSU DK006]|uniref:extracellular solute-binding protein n=1 Tax=Kineococcus sp. SYSU DK006 TaxID=3383127 RepID=UPI003D7DF0B5